MKYKIRASSFFKIPFQHYKVINAFNNKFKDMILNMDPNQELQMVALNFVFREVQIIFRKFYNLTIKVKKG
jgi:hypothetical protein